jgi:hypothetical protein
MDYLVLFALQFVVALAACLAILVIRVLWPLAGLGRLAAGLMLCLLPTTIGPAAGAAELLLAACGYHEWYLWSVVQRTATFTTEWATVQPSPAWLAISALWALASFGLLRSGLLSLARSAGLGFRREAARCPNVRCRYTLYGHGSFRCPECNQVGVIEARHARRLASSPKQG